MTFSAPRHLFPLTFASNLTRHFKGAQVYVKREDLNHTGAHKANNVLGQGLLVQRMGKRLRFTAAATSDHQHLRDASGMSASDNACDLRGAVRK